MPLDERKARHEKLFDKICQTTAATYCRDFIAALATAPNGGSQIT